MENLNEVTRQVQQLTVCTDEDVTAELLRCETGYLTDMRRFFPELIWNQILQKITDPSDIENITNSSPFFGKVLKNKREMCVVLPNVFVLLMDYFADNDDAENINEPGIENSEVDDENESDHEGDDEGDHQNVPIKNILKCREVCKSWKYSIDGLFTHQDTGNFILKFEMGDFPLLTFDLEREYSFQPEDRFQDFLHHFDATHFDFQRVTPKQNPFIGRHVTFFEINLRNQVQQEDQDYIMGVGEILRKYGTHVWHAMLFFEVEFGGNVGQFYVMLYNFLKWMPNLKSLRLFYNESWDNFNVADIPEDFVVMAARLLRNAEQDRLRDTVSQNPLPALKCLQFLDAENVPTLVFNELINKSGNITQLQVHRKDFHSDYNIFTVNFPYLTALSVQFCSTADVEKFENCQMSLNLKRFYFWYEESSPFFSWSRLFRALESKLGESCEELVLQLPMPKTNEQVNQVLVDSHTSRLNLPNLLRLTIFDDMAFCLDFLLPCKMTLRWILLRYSHDEDENVVTKHIRNKELRFPEFEQNQTVKFLGFKEKMEESNIWSEFIELRKMTIHRNRQMGGCIDYCGNCKNSGTIHKQHWYRD